MDGLDLEPLDELDADGPDHHGRADHPVHVETLEAEHLLDPEPADDLGFHEDDAEEETPGTVLQVVPPRMDQFALVDADRIEFPGLEILDLLHCRCMLECVLHGFKG